MSFFAWLGKHFLHHEPPLRKERLRVEKEAIEAMNQRADRTIELAEFHKNIINERKKHQHDPR